MARKRRIDYEEVVVPDDAKIIDVLPDGTTQICAYHPNGGYQTITMEEAKKRKAIDYQSYITSPTDIIRGSVKSRLVEQDISLFRNFFIKEFDGIHTNIKICGENSEEPEYIMIEKFPLPDHFINSSGHKISYQPDYEDIVVIIADYPDYGPFGIHLSKDSPNAARIKDALKGDKYGHQYDEPIGHPDREYANTNRELKEKGWIWQCFHYRSGGWKFNSNDLRKGDCLAKYLESLFGALGGACFPE